MNLLIQSHGTEEVTRQHAHKHITEVPFKLFGLCALLGSFADDDEKVLCQNKGHSLSFVAKLLFLMIQEMAEIYMK